MLNTGKMTNKIQLSESNKYDIKVILKSLLTSIDLLKKEKKLTLCSSCKTYKNASRQCNNSVCETYLKTIKCPKCCRHFIKMGKHNCDRSLSTSIINSSVGESNDTFPSNLIINTTEILKNEKNIFSNENILIDSGGYSLLQL